MARKLASAATREIESPIPKLWPHQDESLTFFEKNATKGIPYGFDNSSPGVGKTATQIRLYDRRKDRKRLLVICPKTLMVAAWGEDIEKFAPELTVSYAYAENRDEAFAMNTDVVIMNTDGVKWLADKKFPARLKYLKDFDHLVIDEYTTFKHATSQRTKAMLTIRKFFKRRYAMSGTPNPNTVMELFTPSLILDDGKRLGTSYFKLRNVMQVPEQIGPMPDHLKWEDRPGATQAVSELLGDIVIRHAFEEVMTHVPANHKHIKQFDLSKKAQLAYNKMENECVLAFDDTTVNAVHAASLRTKLLQIASGAVYDGNEEGSYQLVDTTRYELVCDLVEEREHSVVFFNWKHQRDFLCKELTKRGVTYALIDGSVPQRERDDIVARYQRGEYQTILLHPRTGAHGLTLTRGDATIFCSPIYEADLMEQGLARIYRGTQDKVTNTIFIQAKNTVEAKVYERLYNKAANMADLLDQMRQRRR